MSMTVRVRVDVALLTDNTPTPSLKYIQNFGVAELTKTHNQL